MSNYAIEFRKTENKGTGVFALKDFTRGEVIEICPVIILSKKDTLLADRTILEEYTYPFISQRQRAVVLGYGALYNHSYNSNADWIQDKENKQMKYIAVKDIKAGEEILVNYNGMPDDATPIKNWFEVYH